VSTATPEVMWIRCRSTTTNRPKNIYNMCVYCHRSKKSRVRQSGLLLFFFITFGKWFRGTFGWQSNIQIYTCCLLSLMFVISTPMAKCTGYNYMYCICHWLMKCILVFFGCSNFLSTVLTTMKVHHLFYQ
jgi:hypothetical protein